MWIGVRVGGVLHNGVRCANDSNAQASGTIAVSGFTMVLPLTGEDIIANVSHILTSEGPNKVPEMVLVETGGLPPNNKVYALAS